MIFIVIGLIFYIGTIFMRDDGVAILDVFTAALAVFFVGYTLGNNSHFLPDV